MKIYQVHEYGGCYEDHYNHIRFTYFDSLKAIAKKEELEAQEFINRMCNSCPLDYCPEDCDMECKDCKVDTRIARAMKYCTRCDIEKIECKEENDGYYYKCKNESSRFDDSYFKIEEVEVIE